MAGSTQPSFEERLAKFEQDVHQDREGIYPKLILIILANTYDPEIAEGCKKDVKAIKSIFRHICDHTDFKFFSIEISGSDYTKRNLLHSFDAIEPFDRDITIFYYTGHGFSYEKDPSVKYPQIDLRPHDHKHDIDFINKHTENLTLMLELLRFRGGRVNIVIADCCNSHVPYPRGHDSHAEMNLLDDLMPPVNNEMHKKMFNDENKAISIIIASSQRGQFAISDPKIGSIFTHFFTRTLAGILAKPPQEGGYLPWHDLLGKTAVETLRLSKSYDIGGGKPGYQEAIFEVMIEQG